MLRLPRPQLLLLAGLAGSVLLLNALQFSSSDRGVEVLRHVDLANNGVNINSRDARASRSLHASLNHDQREAMPNSAAAGGNTAQSLLSKSLDLLSAGKYEVVDGAEAVWQVPAAGVARKGVLFIAHGCNHGAIDWWPRSEGCPKCIGLPEEMNVTLHSLLRGYAVVAVSSAARKGSKCWQSLFGGEPGDYSDGPPAVDWMRVKQVLATVLPREGLGALPLFALGGSSGGALVLGLPLVMPGVFAGLAVQIMGGPPGLIAQYKASSSAPPWPPTLFIHMPRDAHLASLVAGNLAEMREQAVRTHEIRVHPQPLTPLYLAQRCAPEVSEAASRAIFDAFRAANYTDAHGHLRHNPRGPPSWRQLLHTAAVPGLDRIRLQPEASPVAEELNLLFAGHELCSETTTDMLSWFEAGQAGKKGGDV